MGLSSLSQEAVTLFISPVETSWESIYYFFQSFSCSESIFGIFPTLIFALSVGLILYKEGNPDLNFRNYFRRPDWAQVLLQEIILFGVFVLSLRTWIFTTKALRWSIDQIIWTFAYHLQGENLKYNFLSFIGGQGEFIHLTICWALCLAPANYSCDKYINKLFNRHIQPAHANAWHNLAPLSAGFAITVILAVCKAFISCALGNCGQIFSALGSLYSDDATENQPEP